MKRAGATRTQHIAVVIGSASHPIPSLHGSRRGARGTWEEGGPGEDEPDGLIFIEQLPCWGCCYPYVILSLLRSASLVRRTHARLTRGEGEGGTEHGRGGVNGERRKARPFEVRGNVGCACTCADFVCHSSTKGERRTYSTTVRHTRPVLSFPISHAHRVSRHPQARQENT